MNVLKGIVITLAGFLTWGWVFMFNYFLTPTFGIGSPLGKATVITLAAIVVGVGIRAMVKGYGRGPEVTGGEPPPAEGEAAPEGEEATV